MLMWNWDPSKAMEGVKEASPTIRMAHIRQGSLNIATRNPVRRSMKLEG